MSGSEYSRSFQGRERLPAIFLLIIGSGVVVTAVGLDFVGLGRNLGFGPNQLSLAISGLAVLMSGIVLLLSTNQRFLGELFLVAIGVIAVALAADLFDYVIRGFPGFANKQIMLISVAFGLFLIRIVPASSMDWRELRAWPNTFSFDKLNVAKFLSIVTQLGLLTLVVNEFKLENQAFYHNIMQVTFYGFCIHHLLPVRYRLPFFLFLSLATIAGIIGLADGAWLIGIGLVLIGLCHLPVAYTARVVLLLAAGGTLAILRMGSIDVPWSSAIWPILGSMFMFRLIVYMYDLSHRKEPVRLSSTFSYFFLLPNVVFPLFPVVDYSTFRRTYYVGDAYSIYQTGVRWMLWGVVHLILYRFVNYYLISSPEDVRNVGDLVHYIVTNIMLLLRISGQFHLIVGILLLFGFNLPRTMHDYFLASSFTDFWRRANIYWKDFMLKVFYYPTYFRLRGFGTVARLTLATIVVFVGTWFLHAYQWFWLRGSFLLSDTDVLFWVTFGLLVLGNSLYETIYGRKQSLKKHPWTFRYITLLSLRTTGTFMSIAILYSLWTSTSLPEWLSLWDVVGEPLESIVSLIPLLVVICILIAGIFWSRRGSDTHQGDFSKQAVWFKSAGLSGSVLLILYLLGNPIVYTHLGGNLEAVIADLRVSRLNSQDAALLVRGYYENLFGVNRFNSQLWEVYTKRPADWPAITETEAVRQSGDNLILELVPSTTMYFQGAKLSINRWGMRDRDYAKTPWPRTYRIALLGPSFVMGSGVADNEVFEAVLEDRLNRENDGAQFDRYEILNFAVAGYSALQELMVLEQKVLGFEPNAIFFVAHQREKEAVVSYLADRIRVGAALPYADLVAIARRAGVDATATKVTSERRLKPFGNEIVSWTYRRIVEIARAHHAVPVWIFMPTLESYPQEEDLINLSRLAEAAGFIVLNLSDAYENRDVESLVVAYWDKHPNAKGHRLLADRLYEALRAKTEAVPLVSQPRQGTSETRWRREPLTPLER